MTELLQVWSGCRAGGAGAGQSGCRAENRRDSTGQPTDAAIPEHIQGFRCCEPEERLQPEQTFLLQLPGRGEGSGGGGGEKKRGGFQTVCTLPVSIRGSGSGIRWFMTPGSGMGKNQDQGSGMNIPDDFSESLETVFWVKNTWILWCGSRSGSGTLSVVYPASGIRDGKNRIRDKHPGSATLRCWNYFASENNGSPDPWRWIAGPGKLPFLFGSLKRSFCLKRPICQIRSVCPVVVLMDLSKDCQNTYT